MLKATLLLAQAKKMALVTGIIFGGSMAQAEQNPVRELYALVAHLKFENAELEELVTYQSELTALFKVDPASALAARRPYSECLNSVVVKYCPAFGAMYLPALEGTAK